jgi:CHAT domain/Effector-associated domain 9
MNSQTSLIKILVLAANPRDTDTLQLDKEIREIDTRLRLSKARDQFNVKQKWAVRIEDIRQAFLDFEPQIVHFCGHGAGTDGLIVENETRKSQVVPTEAWVKLFQFFEPKIECVLLNACYSEVQAVALSQCVPYVMGMSHAVGDRAAILFTAGFYEALGASRSYEDAYKFGCVALATEGIPEDLTPVLKKSAIAQILSTRNPNPQPNSLTEWQRHRALQEFNHLRQMYELLSEKLSRLQSSLTLETDPAIGFKLEKQIERAQTEMSELTQQIEALENKL